jgi:hypothetical protein
MNTNDTVTLAKLREILSIIYFDPDLKLPADILRLLESVKTELNEAYYERYMNG